MSLLSNFMVNQLIKALELHLVSHMPELQQAFLNEVASLVKVMSDWVESKMKSIGGSIDEEKGS